MRGWNLNRFFIKACRPEKGDKIIIEDTEQIKHMSGALRLGRGAAVELCFSDTLECIAEIEEIKKDRIVCKTLEQCVIARELSSKIDLYQGIPKLKKMDLIVQKAVECGVHRIVPVRMKHCVADIKEEKKEKKTERLRKISESAAEQCKRLYIPEISEAIDFKEVLKGLDAYDLVLLADEDLSSSGIEAGERTLRALEERVRLAGTIAILIGPEGGISPEERESLAAIATSISLGSRILRTETAGPYLLAQLNYILQDTEVIK